MVTKVNTTQDWKNYASFKSSYWEHGDKQYARSEQFLYVESLTCLVQLTQLREEDIYSDSELKELFNATLSAIQKATATKLNRQIEVLSIAYLDVMIGGLNNLLDVAIEILPSMKNGSQLRHYLHSIRQGYRLNTAEALGYPAGTDIDQESSLLLHFDYQDSCLDVFLTEIGTEITSPEKLEYLAARLKYFVRIALSISQPPELTDFRRIIFSGDALASEYQKIRETIIRIVPDFADRFSEGIDPAWVSAVGAARSAREYMLNPPDWDYEFQEQSLWRRAS